MRQGEYRAGVLQKGLSCVAKTGHVFSGDILTVIADEDLIIGSGTSIVMRVFNIRVLPQRVDIQAGVINKAPGVD